MCPINCTERIDEMMDCNPEMNTTLKCIFTRALRVTYYKMYLKSECIFYLNVYITVYIPIKAHTI